MATQQSTWGAGDYAVIGTTLQIVGETLCEAAEVSAGERVLDVACGNGNAALAAARRFAVTTGIDYVPSPDGFIGKVFQAIGKHVPPPSGLRSPSAWGTEQRLEELFGGEAREIRTRRRDFVFRYRSPAHWLEVFRAWYGPIHRAFLALAPEARPAMERDLTALLDEMNLAANGTLLVPSTYLEVVMLRT